MHQRIDNTFEFGRFLVRRFMADQGPQSAAALTYTTLFAVVPMMTVTFAMLSAIPAFKGLASRSSSTSSTISFRPPGRPFRNTCSPLPARRASSPGSVWDF